jgi:1-aminocyclopropane-1-carboxylate deaminase
MNTQLLAIEQQLSPSILVQIKDPFIQEQGIELWLKRDDLLHPIISGNKWRKLKYILEHALSLNIHTITSMGGAYSNHLHALAYVGKALQVSTKAKIRGEQPAVLNPSLQDMVNWGMQLEFLSRTDYRKLRNYQRHDALPELQTDEYWLPEGGAMPLALKGVAELISEFDMDYDVVCVPCGTATTLAGVISALPVNKQALGFAALKGASFLYDDVRQILKNTPCHNNDWSIQLDYHFGGFAKVKPDLCSFMQKFEQTHDIKLEPVYTGKMLYGLYDLIRQGHFNAGQRIIAVHTGGLQGNRGFVL